MIRSIVPAALLCIATGFLTITVSVQAQEPDTGSLRRKQYSQQQAQVLTRQLVSRVLDLQAAQLKQNGLTEVPIYTDIIQMRENLDELVRNEMQGVVQKLMVAQESEGQARVDAITEARVEVRQVLLALMAERQRLYRRMRLARLHAQVRELIVVQEKVSTETRNLPGLPMQSRDTAALANLSRQVDAEGMFRQLEAVLSDMRSWGGSLASSAIASQQILGDSGAKDELGDALKSIREGRYSGAAVHQDAFVAALYKILEGLEQAQGLADNSLESTMNQVEQLRAEQAQLQEETRQTELTTDKADELSRKQESVQRKLEQLAQSMVKQPQTATALDEATQLASEAVAELFEADQQAAVEKQEEVLAKLDSLKEELLQQAVPPSVASADERAKQIEALEDAQSDLQAALENQTAAEATFANNPQQTNAVAQKERDAGEKLEEATQTENLPESVKPMIAEARAEASQAAATALTAEADQKEATAKTLHEATESTRQALENVASTLADARRQQLATKIGELARAAEALDRAAAAQQEITRNAAKVANDPQQAVPEEMEALKRTQSDIAAVANRVAEGTKETAPQAAEALKQTQDQIAQSSTAARYMARSQQSEAATAQQAQKLQAESSKTQQQLANAAKALREAAREAAGELANTANQQLAQIDSVDDSIGKMPAEQDPATAQPVWESLAHEAGQISPEAAARLRQPSAESVPSQPAASPANQNNPSQPSASSSNGVPSGISPTQTQVQQARAELAGRRQPIANDKKAAEEIAKLLENVSGSSERIQELSEQLLADADEPTGESEATTDSEAEPSAPEAAAPGAQPVQPAEGSPQPGENRNPIAAQLAESMRSFANSQRRATQLSSSAAQQSQIANQGVREALQTASRLPVPQLPPSSAAETATNDPSGPKTPQTGESVAEGSTEGQSPGSPSEGSPGSSSSAAPTQPGHSPQQTADMGSSMTSPSPQVTAQALAGAQAMDALWGQLPELLADGDPNGQEVATIDPLGMAAPASAMLDNPTSANSSEPTDATASNAMQGQNTNDQASSSQVAASENASSGDQSNPEQAPGSGGASGSNPAARSFEKKPWFTKLPPGVQQSIRASVRRSPPPGYEERLRRYFENVD